MKIKFLFLVFTILISSCSTPAPMPTATPSLRPTFTLKPTYTIPPTEETKELTQEDVGLIIGKEVEKFIYKRCYVNTDTHFHAGDGVYFEIGNSDKEYIVYAPTSGKIMFASKINDSVGWEIRVETDFIYKSKKVWYDLVHHDGLVGDIQIGDHITQGEQIAIVRTARDNGRIEKLVDIAFRNGPRGPNPQVDPFYPESYIDVFPFVEDDLMKREGVTFEICEGNPK